MNKDLNKKQPFDWTRLAWLAGAIVAGVIGFMLASAWSDNRSSAILAMGPILLFPAAGYGIYRAIKGKEKSAVIVVEGKAEKGKPFNSLDIYAMKLDDTDEIIPVAVKWEYVENPVGQPWQCTNNGKWYHVQIWDIFKGCLTQFRLPDSQYFDPREFANVIKMPAHQKLFERQATLMQKIAPAIMVLAFVASIVGFIATTPVG